MSTATIEIKNVYAEKILRGLAKLNAIRFVKREKIEKPSRRFAGALHLSDEQYLSMQKELKESKHQWERNIF
jgi:hypothetical protein